MTLAIIVLLVFATASSGAIFKPGDWYASLERPDWTPPNWAFPVVWTALYIMIAFAGWLVVSAEGIGLVMVIWGAQLLLNAAWSWLFFGLHRMDLALMDIGALLASIFAFIVTAGTVSLLAAALFVPYAIWVMTAGYLNYRMIRLNPGQVPARAG
ncbi:TspO/MBR family protein [Stappia stellulata]|uniref:TspO/MBR family protein n=1 Tax=Stappia stellulata TaxID=71235 RepID=UPI0003FF9E81|nr:TspO/MBR family protein [Stappia stellulata]